jgi:DNA-directed RNA polymerase subunit RPC12/RpoP
MDALPSDHPVACTAADAASGADQPGASFEPPDLDAWEVAIECFRCGRSFAVPYRYLRSGNVLRCPSCKGSYVVRAELDGRLRRVLPEIHQRLREECDSLRDRGRPDGELLERWRKGAEETTPLLKRIVGEVRPAGAPRKRAGMFG